MNEVPYYAVVFISRKSQDLDGYAQMDEQTITLAQTMPGYLGYESVNNGNKGIFISYWKTMADIENWRRHPVHIDAKSNAVHWYEYYHSMICLVESDRQMGVAE